MALIRRFALAALLAVVAASAAFGATGKERQRENRMLSLIAKFDVDASLRALPADSSAAFWRGVGATDPTFVSFLERIDRDGSTERKAIEAVDLMPHFSEAVFASGIDSLQGRCDSLAAALGFDPKRCRIHVADHQWPVATVALRSYGFALLVNSGLLCGGDTAAVAAALAREYVHGILLHHLQQEYARLTAQKRNRVWNVLLHTLAPYGAPNYVLWRYLRGDDEQDSSSEEERRMWLTRMEAFDAEIAGYLYPYCDEMELQADIVAYRFFERLGLGDSYIAAIGRMARPSRRGGLEALERGDADKSVAFRCELLRFMRDNPDIKAYERERRKAHAMDDAIYD